MHDFHDFKVIMINGVKKQHLFLGKKYRIPHDATHVRIRAGKISFGSSKINSSKNGKRGKFFKIPNNMCYVSFNSYHNNEAGHHYGQPTWHENSLVYI